VCSPLIGSVDGPGRSDRRGGGRIKLAILAIVIACVAAGCAGGNGATTTVTTPPASSSTAPTRTAPKPTAHKKLSSALWRFLGEVKPIRAKYNHLNDRLNAALRQTYNVCCTNWKTTEAVARTAARQARHAADKLATSPAPIGLEHTYLAYVAGYRQAAQYDAALANTLAAGQDFSWDTLDQDYPRPAAPVTRFRLALIEYGAVHRLALPRWVHNIGGR
jgi:hypothetical protein